MNYVSPMTRFTFPNLLNHQMWHGSEPSVTHRGSEGSPQHGDAVSRLCPSRNTLMPSTMAMSAVPPKGGTACYNHQPPTKPYWGNWGQAFTMKGLTC